MPNRSAKNGRYVTKKYVKKHASTTVKEPDLKLRERLMKAVGLLYDRNCITVTQFFSLKEKVHKKYPSISLRK